MKPSERKVQIQRLEAIYSGLEKQCGVALAMRDHTMVKRIVELMKTCQAKIEAHERELEKSRK